MININKIKKDVESDIDDIDELLMDIAIDKKRKQINMETELPILNDINEVTTGTSGLIVHKTNTTNVSEKELSEKELSENIENSNISQDNNVFQGNEDNCVFQDNDISRKELEELDNEINKYEILEDNNILDNNVLEEEKCTTNECMEEDILLDKLDSIDELRNIDNIEEESIINLEPSESIMEDTELRDMDDYSKEGLGRRYKLKSKKNKYVRDVDINNIYKYLLKHKLKIRRKLVESGVINENLYCSDKLLFSLYLNTVFNDINII
jgi:hypothetical protein